MHSNLCVTLPVFLVLLHQGVGLGQRLEAVVQMAQVGREVR